MKKKQHYVPQFYLSYFACDGKVETYNTKYCVFKQKHPSEICYEKYLYETPVTENNDAIGEYYLANHIENVFAKYENDFSDLLNKISCVCIKENLHRALILTTDERKVLIRLVTNFLLRNPDSIKKLKLDEVPEDVKSTEIYRGLDSVLREMQLGGAEPAYRSAHVKAMITDEFDGGFSDWIHQELEALDFCFLFDKNEGFITSDFPACYGNDVSFECDTPCLYMPLMPKVAVLFGNYPKMRKMRNRLVEITPTVVHDFNKQFIDKQHYLYWLIAKSRQSIENALKE